MTQCPLPPVGWVCSREPGHAGPCAARREFPYDEYADKAVFRTGLPWTANVRYIGAPEPPPRPRNKVWTKAELVWLAKFFDEGPKILGGKLSG